MTDDNRHALLSSNRHDWITPPWFLDLVREVGPIELDPCTTPDNPCGARRFITKELETCGLSQPWDRDGLAFVNCPYGPYLSGPVEPNYEHVRQGVVIGEGRGWARRITADHEESIVLVPVRTETVWWRELYAWSDCALLWSSEEFGSRINFVNADTGEVVSGSNLASTVFYRAASLFPLGGLPYSTEREDARARSAKFRRVFGPHGTLIP